MVSLEDFTSESGEVFLDTTRLAVPEAPALPPPPPPAVEPTMPIWPGGATVPALDRCALPYATVQARIRNGLANTR